MYREKITFFNYVSEVVQEMTKRKIKYQEKYFHEIYEFCQPSPNQMFPYNFRYSEHNQRYFIQCYYNLQEKHDRGIITDDEWHEIEGAYYKYFGED